MQIGIKYCRATLTPMRKAMAILWAGLVFAMAGTSTAHEKGAQTQTVVKASDCRWLTRHQPIADVAFAPGIDARGRKVAAANLDGGPNFELPRELTIILEIPLVLLGEESRLRTLSLAELDAGRVTVDRVSGRVSYNGQPLVDPAREKLATACREALKR